MSEAADSSVRPRAAESGAECFVPAADQARLGPASTGTPPTQMLTPGSCDRPQRGEEILSGNNRSTVCQKYSLQNPEGHGRGIGWHLASYYRVEFNATKTLTRSSNLNPKPLDFHILPVMFLVTERHLTRRIFDLNLGSRWHKGGIWEMFEALEP